MKKTLLNISLAAIALFSSAAVSAQTTNGTLTFTYTPIAHTSYSGTKSVIAVWIQNTTGTGTGTFVETKFRYVGGGTSDHLPTWAANAGCSSSTSATSTTCNTTGATTGATLASFVTKTFTWNGKGAVSGTTVPDGTYKVTIQETWNHGTTGTVTTSFTWTKGTSPFHLAPAADANFSGVVLDWVPDFTGIEEAAAKPDFNVYPNPTSGMFKIDYTKASEIKVVNTLGALVYSEKLEQLSAGSTNVDLSNFANGIYFITVTNDKGSVNRKLILNK